MQPHEVCKKLLAIKPSKAHGPDNVPCRIVKEFAYELAEPVTRPISLTPCLSKVLEDFVATWLTTMSRTKLTQISLDI